MRYGALQYVFQPQRDALRLQRAAAHNSQLTPRMMGKQIRPHTPLILKILQYQYISVQMLISRKEKHQVYQTRVKPSSPSPEDISIRVYVAAKHQCGWMSLLFTQSALIHYVANLIIYKVIKVTEAISGASVFPLNLLRCKTSRSLCRLSLTGLILTEAPVTCRSFTWLSLMLSQALCVI